MVRVVRLERTVSWSQTRRDTNFAIPGYSISAMIPRRGVKIKIFLSVVIYVVKGDFVPLSAIGENPANAGVAGFAAFDLTPSRIPTRHSQIKRATICATPGYVLFSAAACVCTHFKRAAALPAAPVFRDRAQQPRALSDCTGGKTAHFAICVR